MTIQHPEPRGFSRDPHTHLACVGANFGYWNWTGSARDARGSRSPIARTVAALSVALVVAVAVGELVSWMERGKKGGRTSTCQGVTQLCSSTDLQFFCRLEG